MYEMEHLCLTHVDMSLVLKQIFRDSLRAADMVQIQKQPEILGHARQNLDGYSYYVILYQRRLVTDPLKEESFRSSRDYLLPVVS